MQQKIVPHLWYDKEAKEAAEFYVSAFGNNSKIHSVSSMSDTPSGDVDIVSFQLWGYNFMSISAGPYFKVNPSISFMLNFDPSKDNPTTGEAKSNLDKLWEKLSEGGQALMPLDKYPFSERYGWIQDKYGVSWQLILTNPEGEERPPIVPSLLYVSEGCDKAEEAIDFYLSVFKDAPSASSGQAKRGTLTRYPAGMPASSDERPSRDGEPNKSTVAKAKADEGRGIMFTDFMLEGQWFAAMDGSSKMHKFAFNEAISFMVYCKDQDEIDYYWEKLSAVPESEQCGWLKDKFGVSWQIVPEDMDEMMEKGTPEQKERVTKAFLQMKKFNIEELKRAYNGG